MKRFYFYFFLLLAFAGHAQKTDFQHLLLSVRLDTNTREVLGTVALTFDYTADKQAVRDSFYLNGINMDFRMVSLNGERAEFSSDDKGIWFTPEKGVLRAKENVVVIHYSCAPVRGLFFIGWDDETGLSKRQVWTQGQGIDHRHWIPYKDDQTDKLVTEMIVTFDSSYQVISNGELLLKSSNDYNPGETVWHYRMKNPQPGYLMMLGVGKYDHKQTTSRSGIPLTQYYYPERENDYQWYYYKNEEIFNFLEREIGMPYPWQNYKQVPVQDFQHGAMENTTATIFGDFFLVDEHAFNDRNYTYVNAHELAHQWFGNLVTAEGSEHHWLHEGFATYYEWLSERNLYGEDSFDWIRYKAAQMVFEASKIDTIPLGNGKAGSSRFYQKGAWVLYMLDQQLGHENFRKAIKHYLEKNKFGVVTTETFNQSIKAVTGKDFSKFFEQWVYAAGEPRFRLDILLEEEQLDLMYVPEFMPFSNPSLQVPVEIRFKGDSSLIYPISVKDSATLIMLDSLGFNTNKVKYWTVNPDFAMLAGITENKPLEMWEAQYKHSPHMLNRYFAIKALREFDLKEKASILLNAFENEEEFFAIRAEALSQLVQADHKKAHKLLNQALQSTDVQLQKEAILMVKEPDEEQLQIIAELCSGNSYELRENAIHKRINTEMPDSNLWLNNLVFYKEPGFPGHKVAITALLYRTAFLKDGQALEELKEYTSSGYDFITRTKAMEALSALKYFDRSLAPHYFDGLFSLNRTLSRETRFHLKQYYQKEEYKTLINEYIQFHQETWNDRQKRVVNSTFELNIN